MFSTISDQTLLTNSIQIHYLEAGPSDGPLVVLLHGFPEFCWSWKKQIQPLADAGYHVIAPDLRGYGQTSKPHDLESYHWKHLVADIVELIKKLGNGQTGIVVGHDFGGVIAWLLGTFHPDVVRNIAVIDAPHPAILTDALEHSSEAWIIKFFNIPLIPEAIQRITDGFFYAARLRQTSRPGTFSKDELDDYRKEWRRKDAAMGMMNWFRASLPSLAELKNIPKTCVPSLVIWGTDDRALPFEMAEPSLKYCENVKFEKIEHGTHWVHIEEADRINALLLEFFKNH